MSERRRVRWDSVRSDSSGRQLRDFLETLAAVPAVALAKERSFDHLQTTESSLLLDAGSGTGVDAVNFLRRYPACVVVGVDLSEFLLATARRRIPPNVVLPFAAADLTALPFRRGAFAGCRSERTLQHLANPRRAVEELVRVTQPGGRIVCTEMSLDGIRPAAGSPGHPWLNAGTPLAVFLPALLHRSGARNIQVDATTASVDLDTETLEHLGIESTSIMLRAVHVIGTVST